MVAEFAGREMVLDAALEERIWAILERLTRRWPDLDQDAMRAANRKQARGARGGDGARAGRDGARAGGARSEARRCWCCPGPPRELQPMWETALETDAMRAALAGAGELRRGMLRLFGIPESEIARDAARCVEEGAPLDALEITTCLRRGGDRDRDGVLAGGGGRTTSAFVRGRARSATARVFSDDGSTIDDQVAALLARPDGRDGGVVHGRPAGGAADRAAGLVGVRARRARRLLERGQGRRWRAWTRR